jgi:hypothetical protein
MSRTVVFLSGLTALVLSPAGCYKSVGTDAGTDAHADFHQDPAPDLYHDPGYDPVPDPSVDPWYDPTPDLPWDPIPDVPVDSPGCTIQRPVLTMGEQWCDTFEGDYVYSGFFEGSSSRPPSSVLSVELWTAMGGPHAPGTYAFDDTNYANCGLCGILDVNCSATTCDRTFLITSGIINITSIGAVGELFTATVTHAEGIEVTIDPGTYTSTPVPLGQTFCFDSAVLSATITRYEG